MKENIKKAKRAKNVKRKNTFGKIAKGTLAFMFIIILTIGLAEGAAI